MRIVLISLARAVERRERMVREFARVGLEYETKDAKDGRALTPDDLARVDWETRRQLGRPPLARGSIANWLTQREAMADLVAHGPDMMAVFEDDALLTPRLPAVLEALARKPFDFDVVSLYRHPGKRRFTHASPLTAHHAIGRLRYGSTCSVGYVITRHAAEHFLKTTPKMVFAIDNALFRYWLSGLNVFYVDPSAVLHGGAHDSLIELQRQSALRERDEADPALVVGWRRLRARCIRAVREHSTFRKLVRGELSVTQW